MPNQVLDIRTVPPQPFPFRQKFNGSITTVDADGYEVYIMSSANQQAHSTMALMNELLNYYTEAEAYAQTDVLVGELLDRLRDRIEELRAEVAA